LETESPQARRGELGRGEMKGEQMNPKTGEVKEFSDYAAIRKAGFIPIFRDLTAREKNNKQIKMYSPCGCGSGIKFKFCCHTKTNTERMP
jgi:uncharacterized protein YchJ